MEVLGAASVCAVLALIAAVGYVKGLPVFDLFTAGAREGLETALRLLPTLVGLITAISMLRASGVLELLCGALRPLTDAAGVDPAIVPLALPRPLSGRGPALGVLRHGALRAVRCRQRHRAACRDPRFLHGNDVLRGGGLFRRARVPLDPLYDPGGALRGLRGGRAFDRIAATLRITVKFLCTPARFCGIMTAERSLY